MSTLYDLFKVNENATFDEIKESYDRILKKSEQITKTDKITEQLRRIEIAYGILSNPEKRKKYDIDLANKRADELLKNVQPNQENEEISNENQEKNEMNEERIKAKIEKQINQAIQMQEKAKTKSMEEELDYQKQINKEEKYQKKLQRKTKRLEKKNQQLERERQINEYGKFLESQGYKVKYPWTWLRIKRLLIAIFSILISLFILWHIPFVRKTLMTLYEENFVIHILVNIFKSVIDGLKNIFK